MSDKQCRLLLVSSLVVLAIVTGIATATTFCVGVETPSTDQLADQTGDAQVARPCPKAPNSTELQTSLEGIGRQLSSIEELLKLAVPPCNAPQILGNIYFDHGSFTLDNHKEALQDIVRKLKDPQTCGLVVVEGLANSIGSTSYNLDLSESRANIVLERLRDQVGGETKRLAYATTARGELHDIVKLGRDSPENRKVRVFFQPTSCVADHTAEPSMSTSAEPFFYSPHYVQ